MMHPHEINRASLDRTANLRQCAERYRDRTLARAARTEAQTSHARFRAKVAAALRDIAERLDPSRHGRTPEAQARRPRSA